jgi:hypothetical protein
MAVTVEGYAAGWFGGSQAPSQGTAVPPSD